MVEPLQRVEGRKQEKHYCINGVAMIFKPS